MPNFAATFVGVRRNTKHYYILTSILSNATEFKFDVLFEISNQNRFSLFHVILYTKVCCLMKSLYIDETMNMLVYVYPF